MNQVIPYAVSDGKRPLVVGDLFRNVLGEALDDLERGIIEGRNLNATLDRIVRLVRPVPRGGAR